MNVYVDHVGTRTPMHPEPVAAALSEFAAPDAIFTADTGMCNVWNARYIKATKDRRMIGSFNHGSMANALPQAIGAQCAYPGRQVVAMCGDGGFAMSLGDILTVTQYDLPIIRCVQQRRVGNGEAGDGNWRTSRLSNRPEKSKLREACRSHRHHGCKNRNPADVNSGIKKALAHSGPALIDVVTDPNALSIPSHADRSQAVGFALAMEKMVLSGNIEEVVATIEGNVRHVRRVVGVALNRYSKWFRQTSADAVLRRASITVGLPHCAGGSVVISGGLAWVTNFRRVPTA